MRAYLIGILTFSIACTSHRTVRLPVASGATAEVPPDRVTVRRVQGAIEGALIGLVAGAATGAILGIAIGGGECDGQCFALNWSKRDVALGLGAALGTVGAGVGAGAGAIRGHRDIERVIPVASAQVSLVPAPGGAYAHASWAF